MDANRSTTKGYIKIVNTSINSLSYSYYNPISNNMQKI